MLRLLHRWLGLLAAVIIVVVAASGGLLLFRAPYYRAVYPAVNAPMTEEQTAARAHVLEAIEARWRREGVRLVRFPQPGMNVYQVWLGDGSEAFVDPRDATVIDRWRWHERLPAFLFELHAHLLGERGGTVVNGIVALVVVFMSLTGLVFWWPARRSAFRLRGAVPRRITAGNLLRSHAAVGALAALPILVFVGTGAAIVFYDQASAVITRLLDSRPAEQADARVAPAASAARPWKTVLAGLDGTFPDGQTVFYYPGDAGNARLMFRKRLPGEWHPNGRSYVLIDPYSGAVMQAIDARTQGAGTRLMHAIYPVHAAKTGGLAMAALAASAALALVWLGIGGTWSYLGRRAAARRAPAGDPARKLTLVPSAEVPSHALRLADVPVGFTARLHGARLDAESRSQLRALGLTDASVLRVCKQGEPCVVQVRTTRIGISSRIARHVFVVPAVQQAAEEVPCR